MATNEFLTISEFAQRIGIHPQTVRKWDKQKVLCAHHRTPGGKRFYTEDQVNQFLNTAQNAPEETKPVQEE